MPVVDLEVNTQCCGQNPGGMRKCFLLTAEICSKLRLHSARSAPAAHPTPEKELNKNGGKGEK